MAENQMDENNQDQKNLIIDGIKDLITNSNKDIEDIINKMKETKNEKYPRFNLSLSQKEIADLKDGGYLIEKDKKTIIDPEIFHNPAILQGNKQLTPLEKLLLGVIWKNGDYKKESHIIRGILSENSQKENPKNEVNNSYVFWNFGRYFVNKENPIVDQHTFRAYKYLNKIPLENQLHKINNENKTYYEAYFNWFKNQIDNIKESFEEKNENGIDSKDIAYYLDLFLFMFGKKIKNKKKESNSTQK